jgi:hypothetical protein
MPSSLHLGYVIEFLLREIVVDQRKMRTNTKMVNNGNEKIMKNSGKRK